MFEGSNTRLNQSFIYMARTNADSSDGQAEGYMFINGCNSSGLKAFHGVGAGIAGSEKRTFSIGGFYNSASTISSVSLFSGTGNFDNGTIYVYTSA
jgi:hypothetical protein